MTTKALGGAAFHGAHTRTYVTVESMDTLPDKRHPERASHLHGCMRCTKATNRCDIDTRLTHRNGPSPPPPTPPLNPTKSKTAACLPLEKDPVSTAAPKLTSNGKGH
jgi:hypothetical protein